MKVYFHLRKVEEALSIHLYESLEDMDLVLVQNEHW
jgi:hypothetical protein